MGMEDISLSIGPAAAPNLTIDVEFQVEKPKHTTLG